jgi:uncharacterized protein (DUF302 family)
VSEPEALDVVEHASALPFDATLRKLTDAIAQAGLILFNEVDHQAAARQAGLEMPPTTVLTYGHAKGGTPIMLSAPLAALDLPLRVLVRECSDGRAAIAFRPIAAMLRRAGVPDVLASRLEPAQQLLLDAVNS